MVNWEEIRKQFPVLEKCTYLNPAGGSPLSFSAANAGKQYFDEMLEKGDAPYEQWLLRTEETREKMAELINASPDEVGFTMNTSSGMNIISYMLKGLGDVLTMRDEFPSSTIPFINAGYKVKFTDPINHTYPVDLIEKNITSKTKILLSSYVQYCTGYRQDIDAISRICKKHNLILIVNSTQALGVMPIDVRKSNIDFMAFSGLKWAGSGYGAGGIFISKEMINKYKIPFAGWQSTKNPESMDNADFQLRNNASVLEAGCPNFPAIFALGGSLDLINSIGKNDIFNRILDLNAILLKRCEETGLSILKLPDNNRSGILIIKTKNAKIITAELARKNVLVAARGEGIRVSVNFFNNEQDINNFINEVITLKPLF
jgi:cysteine desulfurase / selenocysteine lyase